MMKTNYLIPQTEAIVISGDGAIMLPESPDGGYNPNSSAPQRGGFAPGGGDLGGVPAR